LTITIAESSTDLDAKRSQSVTESLVIKGNRCKPDYRQS